VFLYDLMCRELFPACLLTLCCV